MRKNSMAVFLAFLLSICFSQAASAAGKQIRLEFSYVFASNHRVSKVLVEMSKTIEEQTGGRVKISTYPEGTLTGVQQTYDAVVKGIADIGHGAFTFSRGRFPFLEVLDLPLGLRNSWEGTKLANAFVKRFQPKELNDVKVLFLMGQPPGLFQTTRRVKTMEDFKGMKARVPGGTVAEVVTAFGAVPVAMSMGDAYDAMRKGIVQALMSAYEPLEMRSLADVVKFSVENYEAGYGTTGFVVMNKARWNSLPPDIQRVFEKTFDEYADKVARSWDEQEQHARQYAVKKGVEIIRLCKAEEARSVAMVKPLLDKYVREKTAMGLPARDALLFCKEYVAKNLRRQEDKK